MLLNPWSIALLICSAVALFLIALASLTATRVLFRWDGASDSEYQIELEGRTWLSAALVQYGLVIQIVSLALLLLAADDFAGAIAGAMCATGSFLANEYGSKTLAMKMTGIFLYGFWIVLHQLDIRSEQYPLIRIKSVYLLFLVPVVVFDIYWLFRYLADLEPDVITSCCGVIFSSNTITLSFIDISWDPLSQMAIFYLFAGFLFIFAIALKGGPAEGSRLNGVLQIFHGLAWVAFFLFALVVLTTTFSSYIYAMPTHKCPFCMLQRQYHYIGFPIYISLFSATFLAVSASLVTIFRQYPGLARQGEAYRRFALRTGLSLLLLFVSIVSYPLVKYMFFGGEN